MVAYLYSVIHAKPLVIRQLYLKNRVKIEDTHKILFTIHAYEFRLPTRNHIERLYQSGLTINHAQHILLPNSSMISQGESRRIKEKAACTSHLFQVQKTTF